jgi:hypothetical protein
VVLDQSVFRHVAEIALLVGNVRVQASDCLARLCHDDCAACGCLTFRCARRNIRSGRRKWRGIGYFLTGIGHQEHRQSEIAADCCGALWQWLRVGLLDAEADIPAARLTLGLSPAS